ncbi:MAG: lipoyl(octanoyl) transferase LipB [Mariprofundaceae bacterium]
MSLKLVDLAQQPYTLMWGRLKKQATLLANGEGAEVIYACEHESVYTTGQRGIDNRLDVQLSAPLIVTDRGGETTYHGPGQLMLYPIVSLRKRGLSVRQYIDILEQSAINSLANYGIKAVRRCGLPGVWAEQGKLVAVGIRISQGIAYHGMAMNRTTDLSYFRAINPCGIGQSVANMQELCATVPSSSELAKVWASCLVQLLER